MIPRMGVALSWVSSVALAADCSVGGSGLCGCSELVSKGVIKSLDDCTQSAAVSACKSGVCKHDDFVLNQTTPSRRQCRHRIDSRNKTTFVERAKFAPLLAPAELDLPYHFEDPSGPLKLKWGFPDDVTIEIEFTLPSPHYIGLGLTPDGVGDTIAGWVDEKKHVHVGDYWDAGSREPETDEAKGCKPDVEMVSGSYSDWETTIRFRRKLDTADSGDCDQVIKKGPMTITYAYCNEPWCYDVNTGCPGYEDRGCLEIAHSLDAAGFVDVDFSGNGMLSTDIVVV